MHKLIALLMALSCLPSAAGLAYLPAAADGLFADTASGHTLLGKSALPFGQLDRCIEKDAPLADRLAPPSTDRATGACPLYCYSSARQCTPDNKNPAFGGLFTRETRRLSSPFSASPEKHEYGPPGGGALMIAALLLFLVSLSRSNLPLPAISRRILRSDPACVMPGLFFCERHV